MFWSVVFFSSTQQLWTVSQLDCDMWWKVDFIQQLVMTSSVAGPRRSSKALPKAKLAPHKSHDHFLMVCCPSDPLQLSESWRNHYIWEVCSANWWDAPKTAMPAAGIGQQNGPNSSPRQLPTTHCTTNASKDEPIGLEVMISILINKNVFETSQNGLKCRVCNHNYFCTNLIFWVHWEAIGGSHTHQFTAQPQRRCTDIYVWFSSAVLTSQPVKGFAP